jgi:PPOX class probable F420-dependent enzyme
MRSIPDSHRDLLDAQVGTLATIGRDGRPQLSEVWFLAEGDTVRISLNNTRQKVKNLLANPAATLFILDLAGPFRYLEIRGDAELERDDDYVVADRVGAKYGGTDLRTRDQPGEYRYAVTINPTRINAVDMSKH